MKITPQSRFWNNKKIVDEFSSYEAPEYWKVFFCKFKNTSHMKLLDMGCGAGRNAELATHYGFDVYACDLHIGMVRATQTSLSKYYTQTQLKKRIIRADFQRLPYRGKTFNILIANGVLHNANTFQKFTRGIKEISRVLKDGGYLCLNVFCLETEDSTMRRSKKDKDIVYTDLGLPMVLISKERIIAILRESGLLSIQKPITYKSNVNTGTRYVLRGIFKKIKKSP